MSALYQLRFQGVDGPAQGVVYVGRGVLLGTDLLGNRYSGSYVDQHGTLLGKASLTVKSDVLIAGQPVPSGTVLPIGFNLTENFATGGIQAVTVGGQSAQVTFNKIGDIP